jgi:hypothetical protein
MQVENLGPEEAAKFFAEEEETLPRSPNHNLSEGRNELS